MVWLPLHNRSYVRIDVEYEVPISVLEQAEDCYGSPYMLWLKHHGGIRHLRSFLQQRSHRQVCPASSTATHSVGKWPDLVQIQQNILSQGPQGHWAVAR